tara:strand:- start:1399 stop:1752 length:354 start_codon:yes stop_codon:yes gene_type:complete
MSNLIKTLNKIHDSKAVGLKSEKLELASVADLKKLTGKVSTQIKKLKGLDDKVDKIKAELRSALDESKDLGVKEAGDFTKKALDLGVKPDSIPEYKEWQKTRDALGKQLSNSLKKLK